MPTRWLREKRLRQARGPEQIAGLLGFNLAQPEEISRTSSSSAIAGRLTCSQRLAFPGKHVAGEIKLMQTLHDDDLYARGRIIDAAAKRGIETQVDRFPFDLADGLLGVEGIVKDQNIATHAGGGGLHAGGEHGAALGILIVALDVLVTREREDAAPVPWYQSDSITLRRKTLCCVLSFSEYETNMKRRDGSVVHTQMGKKTEIKRLFMVRGGTLKMMPSSSGPQVSLNLSRL